MQNIDVNGSIVSGSRETGLKSIQDCTKRDYDFILEVRRSLIKNKRKETKLLFMLNLKSTAK